MGSSQLGTVGGVRTKRISARVEQYWMVAKSAAAAAVAVGKGSQTICH